MAKKSLGAKASGWSDATTLADAWLTGFPGYVTGKWYQPFGGIQIAEDQAPGSGSIRLMPIVIKQKITIGALATRVATVSASGNVQFAIYASDSISKLPFGTPVYKSASVSTTSLGVVSITGVATTLNPGIYWFCTNSDNAQATYPGHDATTFFFSTFFGSTSTTNLLSEDANIVGLGIAQTYGTWPTLSGSSSFTEITTATIPLVIFQVSAIF